MIDEKALMDFVMDVTLGCNPDMVRSRIAEAAKKHLLPYESAKEPDALGGITVVGMEETVDAVCNGHAAWDRGGSPNTLGWHVRQALRPVFNKLHEEEERGNYWKAQALEHLDTIAKLQGDIDKSTILHIHGKAAKEPVSLERCADAIDAAYQGMGFDEPTPEERKLHRGYSIEIAKAVLTAAGVPYYLKKEQ
jgi:hypothetical protein